MTDQVPTADLLHDVVRCTQGSIARTLHANLLLLSCVFLTSCIGGSDILSAEPASGTLRAGQVILVNDGRCPIGQVSQITGGDNLVGRAGTIPRTRACVVKP